MLDLMKKLVNSGETLAFTGAASLLVGLPIVAVAAGWSASLIAGGLGLWLILVGWGLENRPKG